MNHGAHVADLENALRLRWPGLSQQRRGWAAQWLARGHAVLLVLASADSDGRGAFVFFGDEACEPPERRRARGPSGPDAVALNGPEILAAIAKHRRIFTAPNRRNRR